MAIFLLHKRERSKNCDNLKFFSVKVKRLKNIYGKTKSSSIKIIQKQSYERKPSFLKSKIKAEEI